MWRPCQNASKISSKRSQSEWVAHNSDRSAGLSMEGRAPAREASTASASRVSARPTLKPLSRKVRAKPASFCRTGSPMLSSARLVATAAIVSRHLAEQARAHLAREPRAVLVRLEQADHGLVHGLRLLPQIVQAEAGQRRGPVERLGDARHLAQVLLAHRRDHAGDL